MPRRAVFFSFDFETDCLRVNVVRQASALRTTLPQFLDKAQWEEVRRGGADAIRRWIDREMAGCSVLAVLIGERTADRPWVNYEIRKAFIDGKGIIGIRIHDVAGLVGSTCSPGPNPLDRISIRSTGSALFSGAESRLSQHFPTYNWKSDNGYLYIDDWLEAAIAVRNRLTGYSLVR